VPRIEVIAPSHNALDIRSSSLAATLGELVPDVVLHTAGPFQGQDYTVARACIDAGCHYVDLADGREFVTKFSQLDADARRAGVTLVSGASTLPGISSSVVEAARNELEKIDGVEISIAPAHQTPRGRGTIAAVLSYCGQAFTTLRGGNWETVYGWQDLRSQRYPGFRHRLSAVCDVPDLDLMPLHFPELRTATFHAALEARWEQLALWIMAWLTRLRIVRDWTSFATIFASFSKRLVWLGSDRGGMHVRVGGTGLDGRRIRRDWYIFAGENHGSEIPCTPSIVVTKKLLSGELSDRGAVTCWNLFSIAELLDELKEFDISVQEYTVDL
jgi:hypothetical protein